MRTKLSLAIVVVAALLSLAVWSNHGKAASEKVTTYEYQVISSSATAPDSQQLNNLGAQGWELVGVTATENSGQIILYLKRTRKSG